ncbi:unnamed protein product [Peronospora belbahrii]|uniref:Uncharacterized protein n=1 Tax=Peronospora belbahrii TaxID=622444 RepID=A0AAU9KYE2_9STRA|nr:unnamed protein product [Peronospora belbahrii]CAH0517642.1 unnamed protein product [Peronospora belbahrii]
MATVRTTSLDEHSRADKKRKRKQNGKSKDLSISPSCAVSSTSCSCLNPQLETLENWHRALTIDLREVRREGFRVRLELEKMNETVEEAVEKAQDCALRAQSIEEYVKRESRKAIEKRVEEAVDHQVQAVKAHASGEMRKLHKSLMSLDKKVETYNANSINEELLMTQLTQLQEENEKEWIKVQKEYDVVMTTQQKRLKKMEKMIMQVNQKEQHQMHRMEELEKLVHTLKKENKRLSQKMTQMATRQEVEILQQQVEIIKRENEHGRGRMRVGLNVCNDRLDEVEKKVVETENKVLDVKTLMENVGPGVAGSTPAQLMHSFPSRGFLRQADLVGIYDELQRINRDFQAVAVDLTSLAKRTDTLGSEREKHAEAKLQELSTQLFNALNHDSRLHAAEIRRLKDAMLDVQNNYYDLGQRMRRLEDDVQQATAFRVQARSPRDRGRGPGRRYEQNPPSLLPTQPQPPSSATFRNHRDRPSRYEPAPATRKSLAPAIEPSPLDRITWAPRETNRSRSRSPPRRMSWNASRGLYSDSEPAVPAPNSSCYRHDDQRYDHQSNNGVNVAMNLPSQPIDSSPGACRDTRRDTAEHNQEKKTTAPFRRNRQPRKIPEVIVIEEDNDHEDDDEEEVVTVQSRAPPDVIMDEGVSQPVDVVMTPPQGMTNTKHADTIDFLQKEEDLQMGFWLYFCLGGAPDLDVQWTTYFTQLKADDCVEMPRVLRFQRLYVSFQSFPVYLTQCILQAVIVNGQSVREEIGAEVAGITSAQSAQNLHAKFNEVVKEVHLLWAKTLAKHLTKRASALGDLAPEKLELSVNPAGLSSPVDKDDVIYGWSRRQESVMWLLARQLHYGSFLPAMICNVDTSPSVYLFTLMFDVLTVTSECPQFGSFRLNSFGSTLMTHLWDQTLTKLPYVFFVDWAWLEDQSTTKVMPALAFCHILASILLWNSAIDHNSLTNRNIYAATVKHIFPKLYVGGQSVHDSTANISSLQLAEWEFNRIELHDLDSTFASMLGLDGFFEVTEAIQNNMRAATAAVKG